MADSGMLACLLSNAIQVMPCLDAILTMILIGPYRNAIIAWAKTGGKKLKHVLWLKRQHRVSLF